MEAVAIQGHVMALGRGEETDLTESKSVQDLGTQSVSPEIHADWFQMAGTLVCLPRFGDI